MFMSLFENDYGVKIREGERLIKVMHADESDILVIH